MSNNGELHRRTFLKGVPIAGFAGSVASGTHASGGRYDFDTPYNRIGTNSVKWDRQIRRFGKDHIAVPMGIADMDFRTAPCVTQALADRMKHENWGYLDSTRFLIDAIVSWNKRRYGIRVNPDLVLLNPGVHTGIIAGLKAFSPPGSKVLMMTPIYDGFYGDLRFCQVTPEEIPMKLVNGRYSMDFEALERRISHEINVLIVCNPHNPTGNCWSRADLATLGEICTRRRVVVFADEIHCDFVTAGNKYTPFCTLDNQDVVRNSITFKAASKSFSLSAMKCAWMFSENADYIARVRTHNREDFGTLGAIASWAALTEGDDWLDELVPYIDANHSFVESTVRERLPLIRWVKAQGTYLSWLDVRSLAERIGAASLAAEANRKAAGASGSVTAEMMVERWMVDNAKVQINPGTNYGLGGSGHMRMNIATSRETLRLALENIADATKKL
jgi:cystathionine beta-lyase